MMRRWRWTSRAARNEENDPLWRLPLWPPYDAWLDSKVANINNAPSGGFAGSITCALFLQRFVEARQELAACRYLRLDAVGKAGAARGRRMPGRARDLQIAGRTLWMIRA